MCKICDKGSDFSTSAGHDGVELLLADEAVVVQVGPLDHFLEFCVVDGLPHLLHHPPQVFDGDEARLFVVEECEDLGQAAPRVVARDVGSQ